MNNINETQPMYYGDNSTRSVSTITIKDNGKLGSIDVKWICIPKDVLENEEFKTNILRGVEDALFIYSATTLCFGVQIALPCLLLSMYVNILAIALISGIVVGVCAYKLSNKNREDKRFREALSRNVIAFDTYLATMIQKHNIYVREKLNYQDLLRLKEPLMSLDDNNVQRYEKQTADILKKIAEKQYLDYLVQPYLARYIEDQLKKIGKSHF